MNRPDLVVSFLSLYRVLLDDLLLNNGNYNINIDYDIEFSTFRFSIFNDDVLYYKKDIIMPYFQAKTLKSILKFHFLNTCNISLSSIYKNNNKYFHNIYSNNIRLNVSILDNELEDVFKVHDAALKKIGKKVLKKQST